MQKIIEALKKEFEYREEDYDQWVMGVSIRKKVKVKRIIGSEEYTVKVVVKTNESIYVDGMELEVVVMDGKVILEELYYEKTPDLLGSPVEDSIKWLKQLGEIYYLQLEDPFVKVTDKND